MIYPTKKFRVIVILDKTRITKSTSMVLRPEVFVAAHHWKKTLLKVVVFNRHLIVSLISIKFFRDPPQ